MLTEQIEDKYSVVSFDFFDTVVTRRYMRPADLFFDLEERLGKEFVGFAEDRINAELECRRKQNFSKEVTLEEIYDYLVASDHIPRDMGSTISQLELELEKECIVVNPEIAKFIEKLRSKKKKVIFISDTYLPKDFITSIFSRITLNLDDDCLYLSSEYRTLKSTGELFATVLDIGNISPVSICHIGDNPISDVKMARKASIHAIHYTKCIDNRYENLSSVRDLGLSRMLSLSKRCRLNSPYSSKDSHKQTIWETTADISAPLMTAFTRWCLDISENRNIAKIYFLSRDGYILHEIAKALLSKLNLNIDVRYLYVSRQSLLFPSLRELNQAEFDWIMAPTARLTPRIVLRRINMSPAELFEQLKAEGFVGKLDKHMDSSERESLKKILQNSEEQILAKASLYRSNLNGYFKQEGLYDSDFAVVDIGWSGTLQRSISTIMRQNNFCGKITGLYFGVSNRKVEHTNDTMHGWFTDKKDPRSLTWKTYIVPMTELFTAALHGGVKRHENTDNKYIPILLEEINESGLQWGVSIQHQSMLDYAKLLSQDSKVMESILRPEVLDMLECNYEQFLLNPTYLEACTYGAYPTAEDQNESYHFPLAKPYSIFERLILLIKPNYMHHHNEWKAGALKLMNNS